MIESSERCIKNRTNIAIFDYGKELRFFMPKLVSEITTRDLKQCDQCCSLNTQAT